ncbi:MAG: hypothetical protein BJ554DRAFT_996, partial [Olpidium bornovanus]
QPRQLAYHAFYTPHPGPVGRPQPGLDQGHSAAGDIPLHYHLGVDGGVYIPEHLRRRHGHETKYYITRSRIRNVKRLFVSRRERRIYANAFRTQSRRRPSSLPAIPPPVARPPLYPPPPTSQPLPISVNNFDKISQELKEKQKEYMKAKKLSRMRRKLKTELNQE